MNRTKASKLGQETVRILEAGSYTNLDGEVVAIRHLLDRSVVGVRSFPPDFELLPVAPGTKETQFEVRNETTLAAARRLVEQGYRPVALNFASAKHPGGGFLSGAMAQEESLARSSGLYASIAGNPMYEFHRVQHDPFYSNYAIYSPDVPVIRDDLGLLLPEPYLCSMITSPAVNAGEVLRRNWNAHSRIWEEMRLRIGKVLAIAALQNHEALVLGAWGCGVFGNDCREVADLFHAALAGEYRGVFARVVFAILDWSESQHFIAPFAAVFKT
jgi:uncharacterized protein (TIGR02452 family)